MDIKLKNNKKNYLLSIITILIILITSIGIINIYPKIEKNAQSKNSSPYEGYSFLSTLYKTDYVLYKKVQEKKEGKELLPVQLFLKGYSGVEGSYNYAKERINYEVKSWETNLKRDLKNLEYLAIDTTNNIIETNSSENLNVFLNADEEESAELIKLKEKYSFYMVLNFDELGNISIQDLHGADFYKVSDILLEKRFDNYINIDSNVTINPVKNMKVVYAVANELKYDDTITYIINSAIVDKYVEGSAVFIIIAIIIITIFGLIVPVRKWKDSFGIKSLVKVPFEIALVIITLGFVVPIVGAGSLILGTLSGDFVQNLISVGLSSNLINIGMYIVNVLWWMVLGVSALWSTILFKYIINTGVIRYIKEKTLIFKLFRFIIRLSRNLYNYVSNIDLRDKSNRSILKILGINFIILSIMCSIWFFGIGLAFIYTIGVFFILRKYSDEIKRKYDILLKATNKIAEGNLDVVIEDDLGVFEPFKEDIERIQKGFKKAVEEEVKSQKMKTDLISNVSHDLKTPLTSIITYVDLLKDENITEEERKSYIDTIDRKSQRLKNLIEDLFEVSKATSKNIQLNIVDVDIVSLMKQTQFELSDKIEESSLNFRWNFPEEKVIIPLDSQKTFRVFENLILNIVKYSMPNSRVYIDIINEEESVEIELKNMSAEELTFNPNEIVERFVRGDKSRNTEGSGLGLAIAKSFVELQGGRLNVETDGDLFKVKIIFNK